MHKRLLELEKMAGTDFVKELVTLVLTESEQRILKIDAMLKEEDHLTEVGELFHKMQGSAAAAGILRLRKISALGQKFCQQSNRSQAVRCAFLAGKELETLKITLQHWTQPG